MPAARNNIDCGGLLHNCLNLKEAYGFNLKDEQR